MNKAITKIQNESNVKALRRAREMRGLSRNELAKKLKITNKAVERCENGRYPVSKEKIESILTVLEFSWEQFHKIKKGKSPFGRVREVKVTKNEYRRSYQKNITKECKVLKSLRKEKGISQDNASALCGYSRPTIGHIENGRIELDRDRIAHIVKSYEFEMAKFDESISRNQQRDEVIESCIEKIKSLDDIKLEIVKNLLNSL